MMKKIVITAWGDPSDEKVWSRTPSTILKYLRENTEIAVVTENLKSLETPIIRFFTRVISRLFHIRLMTRSFLVHIYYERAFSKIIRKHKGEKILFIAEHCTKETVPDTDLYVYMDSVLRPYYKYDNETSCFAKKQLIHYEKIDSRSLNNMTKIFTQNQWTKEFIIREYGVNEKKVYNVHFGVNLTPLIESKDYSNYLLLIVLREGTEKRKGLNLLLEAFPLIKNNIPEVRLAVVGTKGPAVEGVEYYYNQPREVTVQLFKKSTLYTMPALYEPNGITYLEALANKTPIVGLNRFAFPEFAGHGKYGFIVPEESKESLATTIIDALGNIERLRKMGIMGQEYVINNFSWDKTISSIIKEMTD